jgi:predicted HTH transcriptional regulator
MLEIYEKALEEAITNALLHRDYSKNSVIRLFIFKNRIEIISPGTLPNHLTVENIKNGNSVMRNALLVSFGTKTMPYTGIGSGIPRILAKHPSTEFFDNKEGEQFSVILKRRE